jgi:hypothetical protein
MGPNYGPRRVTIWRSRSSIAVRTCTMVVASAAEGYLTVASSFMESLVSGLDSVRGRASIVSVVLVTVIGTLWMFFDGMEGFGSVVVMQRGRRMDLKTVKELI